MSVASSSWEVIGRVLKGWDLDLLTEAVRSVEGKIPEEKRRYSRALLLELEAQERLKKSES